MLYIYKIKRYKLDNMNCKKIKFYGVFYTRLSGYMAI